MCGTKITIPYKLITNFAEILYCISKEVRTYPGNLYSTNEKRADLNVRSLAISHRQRALAATARAAVVAPRAASAASAAAMAPIQSY